VGDLVIKSLAAHLRSTLPRGHLLCRRSGDEFIAVVDLPGPESAAYLERTLERLNPLNVPLPTGKVAVSATVGLSRYPEDGPDWQSLMICADVAMNEAKQRQRGTVAWFDAALGQRVYRRRLIQARLAQAIQERAIEVHYQPEVDLRSGAVIGFEALARWNDPELGAVSPAEFVPVAEEAYLLEALSLLVLETVLGDKPRLLARFPAARVALNIAPQAFLDSRLLDYLQGRRLAQPTVMEGLEIELTESQIASGEAYLLGQLQALTEMGLHLVIDDFGTGYSSLGRLTQFPISRLKIDRSFVAGLEEDRQAKIARLVINLARTLEFEVTAEGVETESQREALLAMGCSRAQGWLYARAMPLAQIEGLPDRLVAVASPALPAG
jgi:predicted signal transduction protein with EAL and GGDEF domain